MYEMIFLAIIKIILLIVSFALSAKFGWNLSLMEISRNNSRANDAKKCMRYAEVDKEIIKSADKIEETKEEDGHYCPSFFLGKAKHFFWFSNGSVYSQSLYFKGVEVVVTWVRVPIRSPKLWLLCNIFCIKAVFFMFYAKIMHVLNIIFSFFWFSFGSAHYHLFSFSPSCIRYSSDKSR